MEAAATTVNILAPNEVQKQEFRLIESAILGKAGVASPPVYKEKLWGNTRKLFCRVARYVTRIYNVAACATQRKRVRGTCLSAPPPPTITIKGGRIRVNYRRKDFCFFAANNCRE